MPRPKKDHPAFKAISDWLRIPEGPTKDVFYEDRIKSFLSPVEQGVIFLGVFYTWDAVAAMCSTNEEERLPIADALSKRSTRIGSKYAKKLLATSLAQECLGYEIPVNKTTSEPCHNVMMRLKRPHDRKRSIDRLSLLSFCRYAPNDPYTEWQKAEVLRCYMEVADHPIYALSEQELSFAQDQIINVKKIGNAAKACNILSRSPGFSHKPAELLIAYYKDLRVHVNAVEQTAPPLNVPLHLPLILSLDRAQLLKPAEDALLRCVENSDPQVRAAGGSPLTHQIKSTDVTRLFEVLWKATEQDLGRWNTDGFWQRSTIYGFNLAITILEVLIDVSHEVTNRELHAKAIADKLFTKGAEAPFDAMRRHYVPPINTTDCLKPVRDRWDQACNRLEDLYRLKRTISTS